MFRLPAVKLVSLQRSEMFIDNALNPIARAPAERNVSHIGRETDLRFAPLERGKSFGGRAFYEHLAPNGAKSNNLLLHFQLELAVHSLRFTVHGSRFPISPIRLFAVYCLLFASLTSAVCFFKTTCVA